jgi:hypothetical protein
MLGLEMSGQVDGQRVGKYALAGNSPL